MTIRPGEKVGIVGRTGSGKSTIINALLRITELSAGSILIDGVEIRDIFVKSLRAEVTVIDQEPVLVEGSFRENVDMLGQHSDEELKGVLAECNLWAVIERRGGLAAKVERNGLSAGEKQLLCICRALLRRSRIVLIDEATANIDARNDELVQRILAEKFRDVTVITIAHRLTTLKHYDKIMVMEAGRLAEYGTPDALFQQKGIYYQMVTKNEKKYV